MLPHVALIALSLDCPEDLRTSRPMPRAPVPEDLLYRRSTSTGSFTDVGGIGNVGAEEYAPFALRASQDAAAFSTFRLVYYSRNFAGIECDGTVCWNSARHVAELENNLRLVGRDDLLRRGVPIAAELDRIGRGRTWPSSVYSSLNVSGVMMRYLGKVADIERLFGSSLSGMHVAEIGVGFGGFAALLLRLHPEIASLTLVDLPEVLNLAQRYLAAAKLSPGIKLRYLNAAPCGAAAAGRGAAGSSAHEFVARPRGYDLVFSMYAYAEVPATVRRAYFEAILSKSRRGIVSDHPAQIQFGALRQYVERDRPEALLSGPEEWREMQSRAPADADNIAASLLVPAMLLRHWHSELGTPPAALSGRTVHAAARRRRPNLTGLLVTRDVMSGYSPWAAREAQVVWGAGREYFPELTRRIETTAATWAYPLRKTRLAAPFACLDHWRHWCDRLNAIHSEERDHRHLGWGGAAASAAAIREPRARPL